MFRFVVYARALLLSSLFFATFIPVAAHAETALSVGSFKDFKGLDEVEIKQLFKLSDYDNVTVQPFNSADVPMPDKDNNTYQPTMDAQSKFNERYLAQVQEDFKPLLVSDSDKSISGKTLLIRGSLVQLDPGSKAARYFVGFGAGHATVGIKCELVDAKSGTVLVEMTQARAGSGGMFGGGYNKLLRELTEEVADDTVTLAKMFK